MPKRRIKHTGTPYNPPQFVNVPMNDGGEERIEVFLDNEKPGQSLLRCKTCDLYFTYTKRVLKPYLDHRDSKACKKAEAKRIREQNEAEVKQALLQTGLAPRIDQPVNSAQTAADTSTRIELTTRRDIRNSSLPPSSPPPPSPIEEDSVMDSSTTVYLHFGGTGSGAQVSVIVSSDFDSQGDADDMRLERGPVNVEPNPCQGQRVRWTEGSVWSTYSFMQHEDESFSWTPIGFLGDDILVIRAKRCKAELRTSKEKNLGTCISCSALLSSAALESNKRRAKHANSRTPHKYLSMQQMADIIASNRSENKRLRSQNTRLRREVIRLQVKIDDLRRVLMKLGSQDIPGASRVLELAMERGDSATVILEKLDAAISGVYRPHGRWTDREYDIAFLAKALGGTRLLYVLQQSHHFPSASSLRLQKPIAQLLVSEDAPTGQEIDTNLDNMLGARPAPARFTVGMIIMLDGIAIEQVPRWCRIRNKVVGFCREHSFNCSKEINSFADLERLRKGLDSGEFHLAKDGAMFVIAPVSAAENYYPTPTCLFGVCKCETGDMIAETTRLHIERYNLHPNGRAKHGDIVMFCTDGEASFRAARHLLCLTQPVVKGADILKQLPGLNTWVGPDDLIGCCDPKHVIKRFAQALRSYTLKLEIGDTTLTYQDVRYALSASGLPTDRITALLNPQDKQNVPIALDLLKELRKAHIANPQSATPGDFLRIKRVKFYAEVVSYFVKPFTDVNMTLAEQVRSLATYAHLAFALYRKHRQRFMKGALYADSMSIVKAVMLLTARYQVVDPSIILFIIHIGTDREEGVFSHVRTQDHACNCDILQLGEKSSIGAEINKIYNDHPDLYAGHKRRAITSSGAEDHVNPASYPRDARLDVGSVNLPEDYSFGRTRATDIIRNELGYTPDFTMLGNGDVDILRPWAKYVGSSLDKSVGKIVVDTEENDDEDLGANLDAAPVEAATGEGDDPQVASDGSSEATSHLNETPEEVMGAEADTTGALNSESTHPHSKFIEVNGKKLHKSTVVPKYLSSLSSRKVIIRQFRAAGMTVKDIFQKTSSFSLADDDGSARESTGHLVNKDLAAFLCRCEQGKAVALLVLEILHFQTNSGKIKFDIDTKELENNGTKVIGQVIDLVYNSSASASGGGRWVWNGSYLSMAGGQQTLTVPGSSVYPLQPGVYRSSAEELHTWILQALQLEKAASELWDLMEPNTEHILVNVDGLPLIDSPKVPYRVGDDLKFVVEEAAEVMVTKRLGDDEVECLFCGFECKLKHLRNHVGLHILRSARQADDPLIRGVSVIGSNPCGWCGRSGCKTQFKAQGKGRYSILSDCTYHYEKMSYGQAAKSSGPQPCTNVPIVCTLCLPPDAATSKLVPTLWKYNLHYHLTQHHLQPDGALPHLPPDMAISSFISRDEEHAIGIALSLTLAHRQALDLPGSDDKQKMEEEIKRVRSESNANTNTRAKKRSKKA